MLTANLKRVMLTLDQGTTFICQLGCEGHFKYLQMVEHLNERHPEEELKLWHISTKLLLLALETNG